MPALTKKLIDSLSPGSTDFFVWDGGLPGFGVRVWPTGRLVFVAQYRAGMKTRRVKIGYYGALTVEEARKLAKGVLGDVARGEDPQADRLTKRKSLTVAQLCENYLKDAERGLIVGKYGKPKKQSTLATDRGRIERHIKPLLGNRLVADLTQSDVGKFIRDVTVGKTALIEKTERKRGKSIVQGGAGTAGRTAGLLGGILSYAILEGTIQRNPVSGVKRPAGKRLKRRLSPQEYASLGNALARSEADGETLQGVNGIKLLTLTGCRRGEIEGLRWSEVDDGHQSLRLQNTKEGSSVRPIGLPALGVIRAIPRTSNNEFVLTSVRATGSSYGGLPGAWDRITARAGFKDVTMHTLRHSYASVAAASASRRVPSLRLLGTP